VSSKFLRMHYTSGRLMTHKQTELALTSLVRARCARPKLAALAPIRIQHVRVTS